MEKYSAFRDRGSGIAPFFPIPTQPSGVALPFHIFLLVVRLTILIPFSLLYFLVLAWLPIGSLGKKAALWVILGVPGIWWIDLAVDGVKKGSLGQHQRRLPHAKTIIAASHTSPIDALYLAAIFDPIFTQSFPNHKNVLRISLFQAMLNSLAGPSLTPPPSSGSLIPLSDLLARRPDRCIVVFPECTTTNGRGILPFSPSLLSTPPDTKIFPVSLKYTPADITTPVPAAYWAFLWNLCSKPTHCIRVRIAEPVYNDASLSLLSATTTTTPPPQKNSYQTNLLDDLHKPLLSTGGAKKSGILTATTKMGTGDEGWAYGGEIIGDVGEQGKKVLDKIAEALARLGRVKRLGLGVGDKIEFVRVWSKRR